MLHAPAPSRLCYYHVYRERGGGSESERSNPKGGLPPRHKEVQGKKEEKKTRVKNFFLFWRYYYREMKCVGRGKRRTRKYSPALQKKSFALFCAKWKSEKD